MVEAPGVEGRETTLDFGISCEVSCEKVPDSREKSKGAEAVGSVSLGLAQPRCSGVVGEAGEAAPAADAAARTDESRSAWFAQVDAINGDVSLRARLVALEHVLAAIGELLGAGDTERARALVRAWTPPSAESSGSPE